MAEQNDMNDELRPDYGAELMKQGVRGKYAARYASTHNIVRIASDVVAFFPNDEAVNQALRTILRTKSRSETKLAEATASKPVNVGQFFADSELISQ